ncbi:MAG TPA: tetratricopeptide repeat protein [Pyrinomonadaceae bacterium]|jgi:tetratricopeptide (TPR) repeat protein|nr:tetratricopeptide repeat protein [Pyrinomonadaceae bacterium]
MSFNKSKNRQTAERYLAQGKIRAAINEYVYIVDNDPADFNTLNILGDLYARLNQKDEAVECFKRLAEHYNKQGFSQKAIAIYNKVARLKPDAVEVSAKLAPLYQMKGLVAEARSHYSVLAEYYKKTGKKLEALKIWQQIAELDPNNVEVFFTLAENYLQENYTEEAGDAFAEAGRRFAVQKNFEKAISAYSKALEIRPLDIVAIEGLITCQITCGYYDEAVNMIERTLAEHPGNIDLISLLLSCHVELGNYLEAENTVVDLVEREPANYRKFLDVVGLYLKNKDTVSATRMLSMCSEHLLVAGHGEELKNWVDEILAQNPEQVDALSLLVRLHAWQREDDELKAALIRMAEAAQSNSDVENEKTALAQLVLMAPQEIKFRERLEELGGGGSHITFGQQYQGNYDITAEVPTFEDFEVLAQNEEETSENTDFNSENTDSLRSDADTGSSTGSSGFSFVNTNGHFGVENFNGNGNGSNGSNGHSITLSENDVVAETGSVKTELDKSRETHLRQELESVDFYLNEGYQDLAIQTLDLLETQFGSHPEIDTRRRKLAGDTGIGLFETSEGIAQYEELETAALESGAYDKELVAAAAPTPAEVEVEVEEISAEISAEETIPEAYQFGNVIALDAALDAAPDTAPNTTPNTIDEVIEEYAQTADEFAPVDEFIGTVNDEVIAAPEVPTEMLEDIAAFVSSDEELESKFDQLEELRSELGFEDSEPAADEDYETHYNLGTAYKEMGLFDDAVEEFQEAVKLTSADDDSRKYLQCCHALGYCFMEKSMPKLAQLWYEKALQSKNLKIEERHALNYDIAMAFEKQGKTREAADTYSEIYAIDVTYRDVRDKLGALQTNR